MKRLSHPLPARQRGVTLIITMLMLVLITLIIVSTIRTSTTDEKMAGAARDRDKAFQAAEAAVQTCLNQIKNETYTGTPLTPTLAATATQNWEVAANWANANSTEVAIAPQLSDTGLAAWPRCMFEVMGTGTGSYRVTGRAVGASSLTEVMLQATYSTE